LAVAVLVHAFKRLLHEGRTPVARWTTFGPSAFGTRTVWTRAIRSSFSLGWAAETTLSASLRSAFAGTATALRPPETAFATGHGTAHALGDFSGLGFVEKAITIGVDAPKGLLQLLGAGLYELRLAHFAIAVGIRALQHFSGIAPFGSAWAKRWTRTISTLLSKGGGGDNGAPEESGQQNR
jgi:hypothetical protein